MSKRDTIGVLHNAHGNPIGGFLIRDEANRENIETLLEEHADKWDDTKGADWWVEDFMAYNMIWWTDFRKDLYALLRVMPAKSKQNVDEAKKFLLPYFKKRLLKPGAKPKNTPDPVKREKPKPTTKAASVSQPSVDAREYDYGLAQKTVANAQSKNEAMSLLRKAGFANNQIADFMKLKPGRVSSGIRAYDMAHDKKKPSHNLF